MTGAVVATTVEDAPVETAEEVSRCACLNCGAELSGAFCSACGQAAHLHRSLLSLGHDILHGVFHFEGKIWRTIPELFVHPGRLTRRYIDGERAKFVSPMALFLFTVFLMFAAFAFTGGAFLGEKDAAAGLAQDWQAEPMAQVDADLARLRERRAAPDLTEEKRASIDKAIAKLEDSRTVMEVLGSGNFERLAKLRNKEDEAEQKQGSAAAAAPGSVGSPALEGRLDQSLKLLNDNPALLAYKLKTNGYKFSWALIPLSVPFMWLLFFWRRDIRLYDHAIFTTYSISFMMLLVVLASLAAAAGASGWIWGTALVLVPPIHMYRQLRGAYGLSRLGASTRLFLLLIFTTIVVSLFTLLLVLVGVLA